MMKRIARLFALTLCLTLILCSCAAAYETLEYGDEGDDVYNLQLALAARGYSLTADGKYGPATRVAVRAFQKANSLTTDGKAGDKTLTTLYSSATGVNEVGTASQGASSTTAQSNDSAPASGVVATVKNGALKLRPTASTSKKQLTVIPDGSSLTVTSRGDTWSAVNYEGTSGYVMTKFLDFVAASPATTTASLTDASTPEAAAQTATTNAAARFATVKGGSLKLRPTAGTDKKHIDTIPDGTVISVTSVGTTWCGVHYNGKSGYVMTKFLDFAADTPTDGASTALLDTATADAPTTAVSMSAIVKGGSLKLRPTASKDEKALTTIPDKTIITVTSRGGTWSGVTYGVYSGYVMTKYLDFLEPGTSVTIGNTSSTIPVLTAPEGSSLGKATLSASGAFFKTPKGTSYGLLNYGTVVDVLSTGSEFCTVSYDGNVGYILTDRLSFGDELKQSIATSAFTPVASGTVATAALNVNLRQSSTKNSSGLATIRKGKSVTVLDHGVEWSYVQFEGKKGYVMTQYLSFASNSALSVTSGASYDTVTVDGGDATAYDKPGGSAVGTIPEGTKVSKVEIGTNWSMVIWNGKTVYVKSSHFDDQYAVYSYTYFDGEIVSGGATLYANARAGVVANNKMGSVSSDTKVRVTGSVTANDGSKFYAITYLKDTYTVDGHVLQSKVKRVSEDTVKTLDVRVPTSSWADASVKTATPLYEKASADSAVLTTIPANERSVACMGIGDTWTEVMYNGHQGYVLTSSLIYGNTMDIYEKNATFAELLKE